MHLTLSTLAEPKSFQLAQMLQNVLLWQYLCLFMKHVKTFADPESFARGGPTLTFFPDEGKEDPNSTIKAGHLRPASETPMMAQN